MRNLHHMGEADRFAERMASAGFAFLDLGGDSAPPAPDPNIGAAARENAEVAREALAWEKEKYNDAKPRLAKYDQLAQQVVDSQLASQAKNDAAMDEYRAREKATFWPVEDRVVQDAMEFDSPDRIRTAAGKAATDVDLAFDNAAAQRRRENARYGLGGGRAQDAGIQESLARAIARAVAMTTARERTTTQGMALREGAAALGRNLPGNATAAGSLAVTSGNSAAANGLSPINADLAQRQSVGGAYGRAGQGILASGQLYNQQYQNQLSGWSAGQDASANEMAGLGQAAGMVLGASKAPWFLSDENAKEEREPIEGELILKGLERIPVESWKYKDGQGDGGRHIGPMAQDVAEEFGEAAAPGGVMLDPVTMNGLTMAGLKVLIKKVEKLEKGQGLQPMKGRARNTEPRVEA